MVISALDYKNAANTYLHSNDFDKNKLPNILNSVLSTVEVSETAATIDPPEQEKLTNLLNIVKNPYLFRVGDIGVHVSFSGKPGDSLQSHVCNLLSKNL